MGTEFSMHVRCASIEDLVGLARLGVATLVKTFGYLYEPENLPGFLSDARSEAAYARLR
jgi:hypothetical protein